MTPIRMCNENNGRKSALYVIVLYLHCISSKKVVQHEMNVVQYDPGSSVCERDGSRRSAHVRINILRASCAQVCVLHCGSHVRRHAHACTVARSHADARTQTHTRTHALTHILIRTHPSIPVPIIYVRAPTHAHTHQFMQGCKGSRHFCSRYVAAAMRSSLFVPLTSIPSHTRDCVIYVSIQLRSARTKHLASPHPLFFPFIKNPTELLHISIYSDTHQRLLLVP